MSLLRIFPAYRRLERELAAADQIIVKRTAARDASDEQLVKSHHDRSHLARQLASAASEISALKSEISNFKSEIRAPLGAALPPDDVLAAFNVTAQEPWFLAIRQEIEGRIEDATAAVEEKPAALTEVQRTHEAGRLFALRELRDHLAALRAAASRKADPEEKDDEQAA